MRWLGDDSTKWFDKPQHAAVLRRSIKRILKGLGTSDNGAKDSTGKSRLRIGFVNRDGTRQVLNMEEIRQTAIQAHPQALVSPITFMENLTTPLLQMAYWNSHDVIVTPHGAAVSNAIVMPYHAAVVELYPPHYYPLSFYPKLLASAGIRHYGYYNGVLDPIEDFRLHMQNDTRKMRYQSLYRNVQLEPPVSSIMKLIQQAVEDS